MTWKDIEELRAHGKAILRASPPKYAPLKAYLVFVRGGAQMQLDCNIREILHV